MAEREGFEPSKRFDPFTTLAVWCFRPLSHLSDLRRRSPAVDSALRSGGWLIRLVLLLWSASRDAVGVVYTRGALSRYYLYGGMAEWSMATVLKTVIPSRGS